MSALTVPNTVSKEERVALEQLSSAHDRATRTPIAEIALYIQSLIGQKWTAYLAGVSDPKAVGKWARGLRKPQPESERKLRDAYQIALLIAMVDDEETAGVWFKGMNPVLDHRAPAWVIANLPDGSDRAMNAALAFVACG